MGNKLKTFYKLLIILIICIPIFFSISYFEVIYLEKTHIKPLNYTNWENNLSSQYPSGMHDFSNISGDLNK